MAVWLQKNKTKFYVIEINADKQDAFKNLNDTLYSKQVQRSDISDAKLQRCRYEYRKCRCAYYQIADIIKEEQQYEIIMYEWTVVNYSMNNNKDSMGMAYGYSCYGKWQK